MKILYVVHYFLPHHLAGTEIYTWLIARKFLEQGHQVMVLTSEDGNPASGRLELTADTWQSIPVYRLVRGEPSGFELSYTDPEIDGIFKDFLAEHRPDMVHFQHTFRLSAGMIIECRKAGIPALITLADYWFICPPLILLQPGLSPCPGPEPDRCARCGNAIGVLYSSSLESTLLRAAAEKALQVAHAVKRQLPRGLVDRLREWRRSRELAAPESSYLKRLGMIEKRQEYMKEALAAARLVIAPSRFLREMTIKSGAVEPEKIIHSDYGFDHGPFQDLERQGSNRVCFGFMGTPVEHKGLHVIVEAMNLLCDTEAELRAYGELSWFPAYARRMRRLSRNPRTRFMGRFEHEDVAKILSGIEVLIVPSLWYENSPLTIHEAFMAGVPVIASDLGGMAELVGAGGGRVFRAGDPEDLARVMREIIDRPEEMEVLRAGIPAVKSIEENVAELLEWYQRFT